MSIATIIATALEAGAAALRRMDAGSPASATPTPETAGPTPETAQEATDGSEASMVSRIAESLFGPRPSARPLGYWRCTHAAPRAPFDEFTVGAIYACRTQEGTNSRRISPYAGSTWSPYWQDHDRRFCYPSKDLDFEYIGLILPAGETEVSALPERVRARRAEVLAARRAA